MIKEDEWDIDDIFRWMDEIFNNTLWGGYMRANTSNRSCGMPSNFISKPREDIHDNLIDASEDEKCIYITIELRGVDEDDLKVVPKEDSIYISVLVDGKALTRDYPLPCKVNPKTAKIKFNNCVLDVELRKRKSRKKKDE